MRNGKGTCMLVEDDEVDVMKVRRAFKKHEIGIRLLVAGNGEEALAMLRGGGGTDVLPLPRLVLLDLNMPRMNGIEFLQAVRNDPALRALVVVVLTTSGDHRDLQAAFDLNVAGYILKPVSTQAFVDAIATLDRYWTLSELP